jgi:transposase-like protein
MKDRRGKPHAVKVQALRLSRRGWTDGAVAKRVGATSVTILKWRNAAGIPPNGKYLTKSPQVRAQAIRLYESGKALQEAGQAVGVTREAVRLWIVAAGKKTRGRGRPRLDLRAAPERVARAMEVVRRGGSHADGADASGLTVMTVGKYAHQNGLSRGRGVWNTAHWLRTQRGRAVMALDAAGWTAEEIRRLCYYTSPKTTAEKIRDRIARAKAVAGATQ